MVLYEKVAFGVFMQSFIDEANSITVICLECSVAVTPILIWILLFSLLDPHLFTRLWLFL